jgi:putative NIF3 family GTP cyclohydrolase 1 type 2
MKLSSLYKKAISVGIENDPRGIDVVARELEDTKKRFEDMKPKEKDSFDMESLANPYSDSRLLAGSGDEEIRNIMVGIDIDVGEITLAEILRGKGRQIDLLLSHHPCGVAFGNLFSVMYMQAEILRTNGVPINIAEALTEGRMKEIERKLMPANHTRAVDAARLLNFPFMCMHTAADNMVALYLQRLFEEKKPYRLEDVLDLLRDIPEYKDAVKYNAGPKLLIGSEKRKAGKIFVDMTGGTEGAKDIFNSLSLTGVNTIVGMHMTEEHRKEAEQQHLNVIIAGHIASDNLGLNMLLDKTLAGEQINLVECSGFRRIARG